MHFGYYTPHPEALHQDFCASAFLSQSSLIFCALAPQSEEMRVLQ